MVAQELVNVAKEQYIWTGTATQGGENGMYSVMLEEARQGSILNKLLEAK
jgi:hypothetical protein